MVGLRELGGLQRLAAALDLPDILLWHVVGSGEVTLMTCSALYSFIILELNCIIATELPKNDDIFTVEKIS